MLSGRSGHDDTIVLSNLTHIRLVADAAGTALRIESI